MLGSLGLFQAPALGSLLSPSLGKDPKRVSVRF